MHLPVELILDNKLVGHLDPEWLHGVILTVVEASDVGCMPK
jgi:hypothetical protein